MKEIDNELQKQEESREFQFLMEGLKASPLRNDLDNMATKVLKEIALREQRAAQRQLMSFVISVGLFLVLGFAGLVYSMGWDGILQMRNTLTYGLIAACAIAVFQGIDHFLVRPKLNLT